MKNYYAMSTMAAVAAMLTPSHAQDHRPGCDGSGYDTYPIRSAYREQREQAVPTAYSTMMQHYYDQVWSDPKPEPTPQVIIIRER
jgi:hypothetical protein